MELLTQSRVNGILNSFKRVFKNDNIDHLTKSAYDFIMLSSGFIAHYNVHGFRDHYENAHHFAQRILDNRHRNQWANFRPGERDYEYYMQKKEIYNQIADMAYSFFDR